MQAGEGESEDGFDETEDWRGLESTAQFSGSDIKQQRQNVPPVDPSRSAVGGDGDEEFDVRGVYRDSAVSDRVAESDALGFETFISVLARFLRHEQTKGPLTVSIEGPWGSGKSTLMRFLADELDEDAHTVWFNAWRHDEERSMWAAFMLEFLQQVSKDETGIERVSRSLRQLKYRVDTGEELLRLAISTALVVALVVLFPTYVNAVGQSVLQTVFGATGGLIAATSTAGSLAVSAAAVGWLLLQFRTRLVDPLEQSLEQFSVEDEYVARTSFIERFHSDFATILGEYVGDDRVYVFVDDLDRCALPRAAELMQSINLMIGDSENVYFVLGMDRDKVAASIAKRYEGLVPYLETLDHEFIHGDSEFQQGIWYGNQFIEKFVQVPFLVPNPTDKEIKRFVGSTVGVPDTGETDTGETLEEPNPPVLEEDIVELQAIVTMVAPVLENNPRRIKTFINMFRLRKMLAHETGLLVLGDINPTGGVTPAQLGKLVAIELRWPPFFRQLLRDGELVNRLYDYDGASSEERERVSPLLKRWGSNEALTNLLRAGIRDGVVRQYAIADIPVGFNLANADVDALRKVSPGNDRLDAATKQFEGDFTEAFGVRFPGFQELWSYELERLKESLTSIGEKIEADAPGVNLAIALVKVNMDGIAALNVEPGARVLVDQATMHRLGDAVQRLTETDPMPVKEAITHVDTLQRQLARW
jgi:hypothetical protein